MALRKVVYIISFLSLLATYFEFSVRMYLYFTGAELLSKNSLWQLYLDQFLQNLCSAQSDVSNRLNI